MHFWSCDITKHQIYKIGHISAIFKIETSGLDKKFHKIMPRKFHYSWGHQVHFCSRDWA